MKNYSNRPSIFQASCVSMFMSLIVGGIVAGAGYFWHLQETESLQTRITELEQMLEISSDENPPASMPVSFTEPVSFP